MQLDKEIQAKEDKVYDESMFPHTWPFNHTHRVKALHENLGFHARSIQASKRQSGTMDKPQLPSVLWSSSLSCAAGGAVDFSSQAHQSAQPYGRCVPPWGLGQVCVGVAEG